MEAIWKVGFLHKDEAISCKLCRFTYEVETKLLYWPNMRCHIWLTECSSILGTLERCRQPHKVRGANVQNSARERATISSRRRWPTWSATYAVSKYYSRLVVPVYLLTYSNDLQLISVSRCAVMHRALETVSFCASPVYSA